MPPPDEHRAGKVDNHLAGNPHEGLQQERIGVFAGPHTGSVGKDQLGTVLYLIDLLVAGERLAEFIQVTGQIAVIIKDS